MLLFLGCLLIEAYQINDSPETREQRCDSPTHSRPMQPVPKNFRHSSSVNTQSHECFKKKKTGLELGFQYKFNAKAWMTGELYQVWIKDWDKQLRKQQRKVLLLQDNFSGHIVPDDLSNIRVQNFMPNLTVHVQPYGSRHYPVLQLSYTFHRARGWSLWCWCYTFRDLWHRSIASNEVSGPGVERSGCHHNPKFCWKKAGILPEVAPDPLYRQF